MGIYLPNMEMPTSCGDCPLGGSLSCQLLPGVPALWREYTNAIREDRRHSDCPLIPVPPHGDLIDREKLYEQTANWEAQALDQTLRYRPEEDRDEWRWWSAVLKERSAFKFDVADAPTIIPADQPKEDT